MNQSNPLIAEIDYVKISQDLGLHKQSLDFIKPKSKLFLDQMTKIRDTPSRGSLMSKSFIGGVDYPKTDRSMSGAVSDANKVRTVLEFL
mgnify:CR=1 FL=1